LKEYIQPQKGRFFLLAGMMLIGIGLQLLNPQIMRHFIDSALAGMPTNQLVVSGLAFLGVALIYQVVSVCVNYLGTSVAWNATNALRADLSWHVLNLDISFHKEHPPGELIERIDGDISEIANFFSQFVLVLVANLLLMMGILIVLFFEDWRIGLVFTLFVLCSFAILNKIRGIAVPFEKKRRQAEAELFGFLEEQLSSTEDIRSNGAVSYSLRELQRFQAAIWRFNRQASYRTFLIGVVMGALVTGASLLAVSSGYFLFFFGLVSVGTVYMLVNYVAMIEAPIWALTHEVESFQKIGASVERLHELRGFQRTVLDGAGTVFPAGPLSVHFDAVSFAYAADEPVLVDLSFHLEPGKVLGLLGRTGSGKTTLARLLFRLYDPLQGRICLDGSDIRQSRLADLRQRVALVTQDVQLFQASVRDNLTFFDRSIPDHQILAAVRILGLEDWLNSMPGGLDSVLESAGRSLSAGEAQLLAFTRVFLRNPGLVILDEASSHLDPATEQRIEQAIERLLANRTAIIIAHHLSTVERADQILILEAGQAVEFGERLELAVNPATYFYQLLETGLEEVLA
jgi:ABC-type multidrug transport system fused ATPase/permease subunit